MHVFSLQPVVTSQLGTVNNLIRVKKSDFEVFDALQVDSLESSDTSGKSFSHSATHHVITSSDRDAVCTLLWCVDLSSSPPGPYRQEVYVFKPEERFKTPPILPPHLLQVILNKDTNISVRYASRALMLKRASDADTTTVTIKESWTLLNITRWHIVDNYNSTR